MRKLPHMYATCHPAHALHTTLNYVLASGFNEHLTEWIRLQMLDAPEVVFGVGWNHKRNIRDFSWPARNAFLGNSSAIHVWLVIRKAVRLLLFWQGAMKNVVLPKTIGAV
jgi:hypothetical protein